MEGRKEGSEISEWKRILMCIRELPTSMIPIQRPSNQYSASPFTVRSDPLRHKKCLYTSLGGIAVFCGVCTCTCRVCLNLPRFGIVG